MLPAVHLWDHEPIRSYCLKTLIMSQILNVSSGSPQTPHNKNAHIGKSITPRMLLCNSCKGPSLSDLLCIWHHAGHCAATMTTDRHHECHTIQALPRPPV